MSDLSLHNEEDIKRLYITPAIERSWDPRLQIQMEARLTDGKVNLRGNLASRSAPKRADYLLFLRPNYSVAVVEAKSNRYAPSEGLQQAIAYAKMLDLYFAYSSNGECFVEHDFLTGKEREIPLDQFPTPEELQGRINSAENPTELQQKLRAQPYYSSQSTYPPRYYQRIAINRTVDAIARGQQRLLLVMATGTGKTYTAFQIVYRLLKSEIKQKILYLADRNILVDQSIQQDFAPLEKVIHKINFQKDKRSELTSYQVYFALYQQLMGESGEEHYKKYFRPDFFDLIIVDECHRGSAKEDSTWRQILEYFSGATQIGMTATPKETRYTSNINYFGEPIYSYSLNNGIDDGFLAPFKVISFKTNVGDEWRPTKGQLDANGHEIEDRIYNNSDYDYNIVLEDRTREVAQKITDFLKQTDRLAKTIVFCPTEEAALRMRDALARCNEDMMHKHEDYVVRITGSDEYGKGKLDYFISVAAKYPVIVTTSKLLSTGADCKMTRLIVLDECLNSMTEFKQIIGRGTRIREADGKLSFTVMDFRGVTRLFVDPEWDGPIEIDDQFEVKEKQASETESDENDAGDEEEKEPRYKPYVTADGCRVYVIHRVVSVYDTEGKLLRQEDIVDYTKASLLGHYASLSAFIREWRKSPNSGRIKEMLRLQGIDLDQLKRDQQLEDVDDFDFVCHIAYDQKPLTRKERANHVKKRDFLNKYKGEARSILELLLDQYADHGAGELRSGKVLQLPEFQKYGKPAKIAGYFNGPAGYKQAISELEAALYDEVFE